jgi:hypothetical protein
VNAERPISSTKAGISTRCKALHLPNPLIILRRLPAANVTVTIPVH